MNNETRHKRYSMLLNIVAWGAIWGIFEATVGYLLHLLPFNIGWFIWYPVACFFMANVYRKTRSTWSVVFVGTLCALIKMLNLLLPGRIDRVLNPAISIVFEALTMAAVIFGVNRLFSKQKNLLIKAAAALAMNTGWRLLYILYLLLLVPGWIREVSVISSMDQFIPFFITQNLITGLVLFIGYQFKSAIFKPVEALEQSIFSVRTKMRAPAVAAVKIGAVVLMLVANVVLELIL